MSHLKGLIGLRFKSCSLPTETQSMAIMYQHQMLLRFLLHETWIFENCPELTSALAQYKQIVEQVEKHNLEDLVRLPDLPEIDLDGLSRHLCHVWNKKVHQMKAQVLGCFWKNIGLRCYNQKSVDQLGQCSEGQ